MVLGFRMIRLEFESNSTTKSLYDFNLTSLCLVSSVLGLSVCHFRPSPGQMVWRFQSACFMGTFNWTHPGVPFSSENVGSMGGVAWAVQRWAGVFFPLFWIHVLAADSRHIVLLISRCIILLILFGSLSNNTPTSSLHVSRHYCYYFKILNSVLSSFAILVGLEIDNQVLLVIFPLILNLSYCLWVKEAYSIVLISRPKTPNCIIWPFISMGKSSGQGHPQ